MASSGGRSEEFGVQLQCARGQLQQALQASHPVRVHDVVLQDLLGRPRLGLRRADHRDDAGQHLDVLGVAAGRRRTCLEVGVEGPRVLDRLLRGEHRLRVPGGEALAVLARTGLHEQRVTLRRTRHIERALDAEVRPCVPGRMDLGVVAPHAGRLVGDDRVVLPAVPQLQGDVQELGGAGVPLGVRGLGVQPEVTGGLRSRRGDDVPARPAAADDVEGGELAGQVVGGVVGGGGGGDEPDVLGGRRQRGEQRERLQSAGGALGEVVPQLGPSARKSESKVPRSATRARLT